MKIFSIRYALYCLVAVSICNNASFSSMNGTNISINKTDNNINMSKNNDYFFGKGNNNKSLNNINKKDEQINKGHNNNYAQHNKSKHGSLYSFFFKLANIGFGALYTANFLYAMYNSFIGIKPYNNDYKIDCNTYCPNLLNLYKKNTKCYPTLPNLYNNSDLSDIYNNNNNTNHFTIQNMLLMRGVFIYIAHFLYNVYKHSSSKSNIILPVLFACSGIYMNYHPLAKYSQHDKSLSGIFNDNISMPISYVCAYIGQLSWPIFNFNWRKNTKKEENKSVQETNGTLISLEDENDISDEKDILKRKKKIKNNSDNDNNNKKEGHIPSNSFDEDDDDISDEKNEQGKKDESNSKENSSLDNKKIRNKEDDKSEESNNSGNNNSLKKEGHILPNFFDEDDDEEENGEQSDDSSIISMQKSNDNNSIDSLGNNDKNQQNIFTRIYNCFKSFIWWKNKESELDKKNNNEKVVDDNKLKDKKVKKISNTKNNSIIDNEEEKEIKEKKKRRE